DCPVEGNDRGSASEDRPPAPALYGLSAARLRTDCQAVSEPAGQVEGWRGRRQPFAIGYSPAKAPLRQRARLLACPFPSFYGLPRSRPSASVASRYPLIAPRYAGQ